MKIRDMLLTALFAALTAIGAFLKIPLGASSFTLQVLFTCMAGVLLGPKYGALSQAIYVALGLLGLPIFTAGGGLTYVFVPSFGFLLGLIPMAGLVGLLTRRSASSLRIVGACAAGTAVLYLFGIPYMWLILNVYMGQDMSPAALAGMYMLPFLTFDALKIAATAVLCPQIQRGLSKGLSAAR